MLTLTVRWTILARFFGRCGSFDPLKMMKSSFSLLVRAIMNFGGHTCGAPAAAASPLLPDEDPLPPPPPPFLLSWAVSDEAI
ncbi:hypothetical protein SAY86_001537 [Trapa natans]|uniref:Uncharacterized protein n=1 Tax=Trapa natans TaxID=22666 RepID=A0AAN7MCX9_TRANT|nr:hypothetical protein SAY86_001537 [Trapa natans]